ncbi:MBL fold metallo-hydrolase [Dactylosporangium sp. CA-139114]|uniref:MBL fold metallo-hydrolase n=1 Tax=Dactylosporangium sp. CA-139114 TaxID=3239931 RepID=UPI003D986964
MGLSNGACTSLQELGPGVFAYVHADSGWGHSNAGLVSAGDAALLVDTQYTPAMTRHMVAVMREAGIPDPTIVVNTHANGDHCWGNQLFPGAEIIASTATAEAMPHDFPPGMMRKLLSAEFASTPAGRYTQLHFSDFDFTDVVVTPPTITFTGVTSVHVGPRRVVLHEAGPAHSEGDVFVHVPDAGVVFGGDLLFADHPVMWAGPLENWIAACDNILATGATQVVPGHGPIVGPEGVRRFRGYLEHVLGELTERFHRGMPYWAAAADMPLGPYEHLPLRERLVATAAATYHHLGARKAPPAEVLDRMARAYFDAA